MSKDVLELLDDFVSSDPIKWGKLSSTVNYRRLELMLLKEMVLEVRRMNEALKTLLTKV